MNRFWGTSLLGFCLVTGLSVSAATLYKIVNEDGTVTYTDRPQPGAEPVDLSAVNSAVMPSMRSKTPTRPKTTQRALPDFALTVVAPEDGATIRNNLGQVTISAKMDPPGAGEFQLFINNQLVETSSTPTFALENVDRGEHFFQIKFLHHSGKILASTPEQVFYLHRTSALINPN